MNRHRGGQPGNQNARKHGYYSSSFTGVDKAYLTQAGHIIGLDDEIALLRARLKSVVKHSPDNIRLISEAASTLARLMRTSHKLGFSQRENLEQLRWNVLYDVGSQLGLNVNQVACLFTGKTGEISKSEPDPLKKDVSK
ncbi:MAG: hypothetical protein V1894_06350 [Chloroflexota bacterium]